MTHGHNPLMSASLGARCPATKRGPKGLTQRISRPASVFNPSVEIEYHLDRRSAFHQSVDVHTCRGDPWARYLLTRPSYSGLLADDRFWPTPVIHWTEQNVRFPPLAAVQKVCSRACRPMSGSGPDANVGVRPISDIWRDRFRPVRFTFGRMQRGGMFQLPLARSVASSSVRCATTRHSAKGKREFPEHHHLTALCPQSSQNDALTAFPERR